MFYQILQFLLRTVFQIKKYYQKQSTKKLIPEQFSICFSDISFNSQLLFSLFSDFSDTRIAAFLPAPLYSSSQGIDGRSCYRPA